jgi:type I restriction enzyme S subunit
VSKIDELIQEYCPSGVKYVQLAEVATVTIGEFVHKNKQNPNGIYPVYNGGRSETGYYDQYNNDGDKIVISARGAYAGFVNRLFKPYWAGNSSYSVTVKNQSNTDWNYIYYYLKKSENKFTESQQKGGIPAVSKKQVESFKIPVPPLEVQEEIVNILDKFTQLEAELSAELDARRLQYEYYRTKLLTFQELSA